MYRNENKNIMTRYCILPLLLFLCIFEVNADEIFFKISAPDTVERGQQITVEYTLKNAEGSNLSIPNNISGFDIVFGPSISHNRQKSVINGTTTDENIYSYKYVLYAKNQGTFTLPAATIMIQGKTYKSDTKMIKVTIPAGESSSTQNHSQNMSRKASSSGISDSDAFIRIISTKTSIFENQTIIVTYCLYTKQGFTSLGNIIPPKFEGFDATEIKLPQQARAKKITYNGQGYSVIDVYKVQLKPKMIGNIEINPLTVDVDFSLKTGKSVNTMFGKQETYTTVKKTVKSKSTVIKVSKKN